MTELFKKLKYGQKLNKNEWLTLINEDKPENREYIRQCAEDTSKAIFSNRIYIRGLVEITNYCKNNCFYCGIRHDNEKAIRYRLTADEILDRCNTGYSLGFRTFVFQGGEDDEISLEMLCSLISACKKSFKDIAVTLSLGEKSYDEYKKLFEAGADRYLLRHETADDEHYKKLHPLYQKLSNRIECLNNLKKIGYQVGSGFMVGSPFQTNENLASDLFFLQEFKPHMVGIGPFVHHHDTPFSKFDNGSVEQTLHLISLIRLALPHCLIPATTALGTIDGHGREKGILAGANVVMPNLSPESVRKKYMLYDNKLATGAESAEHLYELEKRFEKIGYKIDYSIGNYQ